MSRDGLQPPGDVEEAGDAGELEEELKEDEEAVAVSIIPQPGPADGEGDLAEKIGAAAAELPWH